MPRAAQNTVKANAEAIRKKIKEGTGQPSKEWRVEGHEGLVLFTRKSGKGKFYFIYRMPGVKQQQKLQLGEFGAMTLKEAAAAAAEYRANVLRGENPRQARSGMTFRELAEKFLAESPTLRKSTRKNYRYDLTKNAYPAIGEMIASNVTADHILEICRKIKDRGAHIQASNTKASIGGVFRWAVNERYVKTNPAKDVPAQAKKVPRTRTPSDDEIALIWSSLDNTSNALSTNIIIRLAFLTGQRRSEVAGMRVRELDLSKAEWHLPGEEYARGIRIDEGRTKNGRAQVVYLSTQALELIHLALRETRVGDYLFPANSRAKELPHIHPDSITQAMDRLRKQFDITDVTIHDTRRAISNWMADNGHPLQVGMRLLNHKGQSVHERHYANAAKLMEKQCRTAWQAWADHIEKLITERADRNTMAEHTAV